MPINTNKLFPGERIKEGELLSSNNGQFVLVYQSNGDLAIWDRSLVPMKNIWSAGSNGHVPGFVTLQGDGNFVIFDNVGHEVKAPSGEPRETTTVYPNWFGAMLVLQDDGNLVLFGMTPLFQSFASPNGLLPVPRPQPLPAPAAPNPIPAGGQGNLLTEGAKAISAVETGIDIVTTIIGLF